MVVEKGMQNAGVYVEKSRITQALIQQISQVKKEGKLLFVDLYLHHTHSSQVFVA